jgi:hypothetical protein
LAERVGRMGTCRARVRGAMAIRRAVSFIFCGGCW